jgi:ribosome-binding protein aMBF1 (putative translation factor)
LTFAVKRITFIQVCGINYDVMKKFNKEDNYEEHLEVNIDQIQPPVNEDSLRTFDISEIGGIIREIREKEHLTIGQLAAKCGTTESFITDLENNSTNLDLNELSKIVRKGLDGRLELIMRF